MILSAGSVNVPPRSSNTTLCRLHFVIAQAPSIRTRFVEPMSEIALATVGLVIAP
jgi:hypothetical protein